MAELPLCSSATVAKALTRAGFVKARKQKGSHQTFRRVDEPGGRTIVTVLKMGAKTVARGTLRRTLELAEITDQEFVALLD